MPMSGQKQFKLLQFLHCRFVMRPHENLVSGTLISEAEMGQTYNILPAGASEIGLPDVKSIGWMRQTGKRKLKIASKVRSQTFTELQRANKHTGRIWQESVNNVYLNVEKVNKYGSLHFMALPN